MAQAQETAFGFAKDYYCSMTKSGKHPRIHYPSNRSPGRIYEFQFKSAINGNRTHNYRCKGCFLQWKSDNNIGVTAPIIKVTDGKIITDPDIGHVCAGIVEQKTNTQQMIQESREEITDKDSPQSKKQRKSSNDKLEHVQSNYGDSKAELRTSDGDAHISSAGDIYNIPEKFKPATSDSISGYTDSCKEIQTGSADNPSIAMDTATCEGLDGDKETPGSRETRSTKRRKLDEGGLLLPELRLTSKTSPLVSHHTESPVSNTGISPKAGRTPTPKYSFTPIPVIMERDRIFRLSVNSGKKFTKPKYTMKNVGRWKSQDDVLLINGVLRTNCLLTVFRATKFSCHFTLKELQERWHNLLYCPLVTKLSFEAISHLHPDELLILDRKLFFSPQEESVLSSIKSTSQPDIGTFERLMNENSANFHRSRTPQSLHKHWGLLKHFHLLEDQSVQSLPKGDHVLNFSDAEDMIDDLALMDSRDEALEREVAVADRKHKRDILLLEEEVGRWGAMVENVTAQTGPTFDSQTLAVLRGRLVRYLMRSKEITLGRSTSGAPVDVDLSLEGPATKVSRKQGTIRLRHTGEFHLSNDGQRPFYVNGRPVLKGFRRRLYNNSVVEIAGLRFIFLINESLTNAVRNEAAKIIA